MNGKFERCKGCPLIQDGETCDVLANFVNNAGLNDVGFRSAEFLCPRVEDELYYKPVPRVTVVITTNGASYGKYGNVIDMLS